MGNRAASVGMHELCDQHERILSEGPVALLHRIVDAMVDNYRPAIQELETRLDKLGGSRVQRGRSRSSGRSSS